MLGIVIFIASETMFFSALFATYYNLKARSAVWPPAYVHLDLIGPSFGTAFLVFSSIVMFPMLRALQKRRMKAALWHGFMPPLSVVLRISAMRCTATPSRDSPCTRGAYGSIYLTMTGFHLLHVVVGVLMLAVTLFRFALAGVSGRQARRRGSDRAITGIS